MVAPHVQIEGLSPNDVAGWPGGDRRRPRRSDRHYLVLRPLAEQIERAVPRLLAPGAGSRVLDIGCGGKPYLPFFAPYASRYEGVDTESGPHVDAVAPAEDLPYEAGSFDVVLCTQVLEHVKDPGRSLSEIHRVLAPGGVAFISAPAVFLYHPDPPSSDQDYWRWTHSGLRRAIEGSGAWTEIDITGNGEAVACLACMAAQYIDELGQRSRSELLRRLLVSTVNRIAELIDPHFPPNARVPQPGSLSANHLAIAVKTS